MSGPLCRVVPLSPVETTGQCEKHRIKRAPSPGVSAGCSPSRTHSHPITPRHAPRTASLLPRRQRGLRGAGDPPHRLGRTFACGLSRRCRSRGQSPIRATRPLVRPSRASHPSSPSFVLTRALVSFPWVGSRALRSLRGRPSQVKGAFGVATRCRSAAPWTCEPPRPLRAGATGRQGACPPPRAAPPNPQLTSPDAASHRFRRSHYLTARLGRS